VVDATKEHVINVTYAENHQNIKFFENMHLKHDGDFLEGPLNRGKLIPRVINFGGMKKPPTQTDKASLLPPGFMSAQEPRTFSSRGSERSKSSGSKLSSPSN